MLHSVKTHATGDAVRWTLNILADADDDDVDAAADNDDDDDDDVTEHIDVGIQTARTAVDRSSTADWAPGEVVVQQVVAAVGEVVVWTGTAESAVRVPAMAVVVAGAELGSSQFAVVLVDAATWVV